MRAIRHGHHVTNGNASSNEDPADLLLLPQVRDRLVQVETPLPSSEAFTRALSNQDWMVVLLRLAKGVNGFKECSELATGLAVNDKEGNMVRQLREVNPHRRPPEIATEIFSRWLQCGEDQSTQWRKDTLHRVFRETLQRPRLCTFLDDELKALNEDSQ